MLYFNTSKIVKINNKSYFVYKRKDSRKFYVKHNNKYELYSELKNRLESKKKQGGVGIDETNKINFQEKNIKGCAKYCEYDPLAYCDKKDEIKCNKFKCISNCMKVKPLIINDFQV